tara:strand:- start:84 stop:1046 length:963 start_codon:yes stop_codon:yes gene_type:complete
MPILEVEVKSKVRVGKFGSSYIDVQQPIKDKRRIPLTTQEVDPFFTDDPLVCRPTLTKSENRPQFAIERGDIPQFNCDVPQALDKELEYLTQGSRKNVDVDEFLTESDALHGDITRSRFIGDVIQADNEIDQLICVSGISFSLYEQVNDVYWRALTKPKIHWSFGLQGDYLTQYNCANGTIFKPLLVTDQRNQQGVNIGRSGVSIGGGWGWHSYNQRYYLEIRHGLNTKKYSTAVDMNSPGKDIQWTRNQHKNTFVLARHNLISPANRWGNRNRFGNDWRNFIPRGIITVKFFADPCDVIDSTESGYDGVQDPASGDFEL